MKIISIRKGFQADHSSTSYEFFAIDKPLKKSEREEVSLLSSRARPTKRGVSFIYHGEWSDLPGGWNPLMEKYYDVMHSESYDWWTLSMAFESNKKQIEDIAEFEFDGTDDNGIAVTSKEKRVVVTINCRLSQEFGMCDDSDYDFSGDDEDEEDKPIDSIESGDYLLDLLAKNRELLVEGDYRLLYGIWEIYGYPPEDEEFDNEFPSRPDGMDKLPNPVKDLLSLMEEG